MNTEHFKHLRLKSGLTQSEVAELLGVSSRTIAGWESSSTKNFTDLEAKALSQIFQPILLVQKIKDMADQAFNAIPSELVTIWIVEKEECFTLPETTRMYFAPGNCLPKTICSLMQESLTTYPLRTGETLNLAGEAIKEHKAKKNKSNRASHLFKGGLCESLLHVPALIPSSRGPMPILLLSLENKLERQKNELKKANAGTESVKYTVIEAKPGEVRLYDDDDEAKAKALADEFKESLVEDMRLLGMIDV